MAGEYIIFTKNYIYFLYLLFIFIYYFVCVDKLKPKENNKEINFIRQNVLRCSYKTRLPKKIETKSELVYLLNFILHDYLSSKYFPKKNSALYGILIGCPNSFIDFHSWLKECLNNLFYIQNAFF